MAYENKVPAVTKAVAIVKYVNRAGLNGASLVDISVNLGITRSHCHNILKGLTRSGWLIHDDARKAYILSPTILSDISSVFNRGSLSTVIHRELDKLSTATGIPCILTRVERDGSFTAVDRSEAAGELLFTAPIGYRFDSDSPAQMRVRLAYLSSEERENELAKWVPRAYTPTTMIDKKLLRKEIKATRDRGYAVSHGEFTPGVMVLAAPIFDTFGNVQMILQCPGLLAQVASAENSIASELLEATACINAMLGNLPDQAS